MSNAIIRSRPRIPFAIAAATASLAFAGYVQPARAADATPKAVAAKATSADESSR